MRKIYIAMFSLLTVAAAQAEWSTPTASEMAAACSTERDTAKNMQRRFALCSMPVKGFMDGYKRGASKGLRTAFISDAKNMATIQGITDAQNRIAVLGPQARCMPSAATTEQVEQVFVNYVTAHPEAGRRPYPEVLSDAIEEYYCSH